MNDTAPAAARTALIVGLGRSGVSAARHLAALGWQLAVTDSRLHPPGSAELAGALAAVMAALQRTAA